MSVIFTIPQRVALVPTTAGYSVLLSVADPQQFVAALRAARCAGAAMSTRCGRMAGAAAHGQHA